MNDDVECLEVIAVKTETAKAILCVFDDQEEHWIPKSVIDDDSAVFDAEHGRGTLIVSRWFAETEGLI
jgi:hypothetical protein